MLQGGNRGKVTRQLVFLVGLVLHLPEGTAALGRRGSIPLLHKRAEEAPFPVPGERGLFGILQEAAGGLVPLLAGQRGGPACRLCASDETWAEETGVNLHNLFPFPPPCPALSFMGLVYLPAQVLQRQSERRSENLYFIIFSLLFSISACDLSVFYTEKATSERDQKRVALFF